MLRRLFLRANKLILSHLHELARIAVLPSNLTSRLVEICKIPMNENIQLEEKMEDVTERERIVKPDFLVANAENVCVLNI